MPHLALRECGRLAAAFVGVTSLPRIQRRRAARAAGYGQRHLGDCDPALRAVLREPRRHADLGRLQDDRPDRQHLALQRSG